MKYIVQPLFLREAFYYDYIEDRKIQKTEKHDSESPKTLGDYLAADGLLYEPFDIPHLELKRFILCTHNDSLDETYDNFSNFDDVEDFLINNGSDWQEDGWYNFAHISIISDDNKLLEERFFSVISKRFVEFTKTGDDYCLTASKLHLFQAKDYSTECVTFRKDNLRKNLYRKCLFKLETGL